MLFSGAGQLLHNVYIFSWDALLAVLNLITPKKKIGGVVPKGCPGEGGKWPEWIPPKEGDSRSACPALNALANHGILPRDGRNIKFTEITSTVRNAFNFAPSFCVFVPSVMAEKLKKNYNKDSLDLFEISTHNAIEHDASLTRQDYKLQPDQGNPHLPYIEELLASASGKDEDGSSPVLTISDLSRYSGKRRSEARATNPDFMLDKFQKIFGSANSSTLLAIFGGKVQDLEPFLTKEQIPEGWESQIRSRMGLTFLAFNGTVLKVEKGIKEEAVPPAESEPLV
ncbi:putative sterigmatocystin biosynthesis peroxidase stcC [Favolaschia claudopus]|uniref:Sterigmatocystin biosynthesis peroxidase stcC n=1 Tax=Favolaschia claudopus TaxID=2862362 RepID=A0AAW0EEI7_9AGAR